MHTSELTDIDIFISSYFVLKNYFQEICLEKNKN